MSLHNLAHHLQTAGRGEDKVLVHMTPKEVHGLQSIAMAHGGSLTINPQTGLPEAGFLSSILPMIAGLGLSMIPGVGPMMAAGIVGGGTAIATGSLKQGLMAGLGAYGGAGLGGGLSAMGAEAAAAGGQNAAQTAITGYADDAANFAGSKSNMFSANSAFNPSASKSIMFNGTQAGTGLSGFPNYAQTQANILASPAFTPPVAPPVAPSVVPPAPSGDFVGDVATKQFERQQLLANQGATNQFVTKDGLFRMQPYGPPPVVASSPAVDLSVDPASAASNASSQGISSPFQDRMSQVGRGFKNSFGSFDGVKGLYGAMPTGSVMASGMTLANAMKPEALKEQKDKSLIRPYDFTYNPTNVASQSYTGSGERVHFNPVFTARTPYEAPGPEYAAAGGLMGYAMGGTTPTTSRNPVEEMSNANAIGANTGYPTANIRSPAYAMPTERPLSQSVINGVGDANIDPYTGEEKFAAGGISNLGGYSDGGRLLRGPGDGVSDSIPASIGNRQPARLADGEFVVPARIVSEIGNGSTEAGARKLYAMMERVQKARGKTVGKHQVAKNTKAERLLPA